MTVVAEENSESSLVETYAGGNARVYYTNAVTEIVAARSDSIDHNKLQQEGDTRIFGEIALDLSYLNDDAIKRYIDHLEKLIK